MSGASDAESGQPGQSGESEVTPRAAESGEYEASSWPRWSDEDWRRWNESWWGWRDGAASPHSADFQEPYEYNSSGTHARGWVGGQSTSQNSSTASRGVDPWQGGSDPWSGHQGGGSHYETRTGGNDKIVVPEFNGEDDREGGKTRGYLRKVEAWRRVTRLPPQKQALILYNSLGGKAWRDAEELDVSHLDAVDGVDKFIGWITERYLDKEVIKAGRYMSDFFKVFTKTHDQDIRDFNMEFDRHLTKLKEIGCLLPGLCSSWWYVDKLRLDNSAELNLLASVGNQYDLRRLQEAAIVQDRMNRRIWENNNKRTNGKGDFKKNQQAFCTELDDAPGDEEDQDDLYWAVLWFVPLCLWFFGTVFWYFPSLMIRSFPHLRTSCLHLTRSQRKREKERRPQPPFGPSVDSAIHDSQQPTSPIGFLFLKLPPPPCAVLLFCLCFLGMFCWYFPSFMTRSFPNFGTSCFHLARSQDLSTIFQKISETPCMFSGKMCLNKKKMFISINFETWIYKFLMFFIFLKLVNHSCQQTIWTKQIYEKTW